MAGRVSVRSTKTVELAVEGWSGELAAELAGDEFTTRDLPAMLDPDRATEMLYWGSRNLVYRLPLATAGGVDAAVKLSRNHGLLPSLRKRFGRTKAERAWRMAHAFTAAGVPTPRPLAWVESRRDDGPSLFVTRFEPDLIEVRHVLRAIDRGTVGEEYAWLDPLALWRRCGEVLAHLHASGLWHRDASIGNLVVRAGSSPLEVLLVDLNRARTVGRLSWSQRLRDLCRLPLTSDEAQRALLAGYLGAEPGGAIRSAYRLYRGIYFGRVNAKKRLRSLLPGRGHRRQYAYEHVPRPAAEKDTRQQATWDHLTDQPFQHAPPRARALSRLRDAPAHAADAARVLRALPGIAWRSHVLHRDQFAHPVTWPGVGVALGPGPEDAATILALLEELAPAHVLLRVHPWQKPAREAELARRLAAAGYDLTFALPQTRELVVDLDSWRQAVHDWGRALAPWGNRFQVGQAINRSKWGVWKSAEYVALVETAREALPDTAELIGPAVIDFEPWAMATALTQPRLRKPFSVCSSLLYVDRRGAPENTQMGFNAVDKARLFKAVGGVTAAGSDRLWVTEVNYPLAAGPHSPAGRAVAVDEETQANYAVRYYLLLLASGMVERVYWWQLVARGYGLVDRSADGDLRRRPAFSALAALGRQLSGSTLEQRIPAPADVHLLQFATSTGERMIVGWCQQGAVEISLPEVVEAAFDRDGEEIAEVGASGAAASRVVVRQSPTYYWLRPEA